MIPLQVRIKGLMRYRDEQVADFSEGSLIAICGDNGAGKSSIFDAITFALYGRTLRVNTRLTQELISEDQDYFSVEFDFEEGEDRFRVQRVRGGRATFGLQRWDAGSGIWVTIPGTDSAAGLNAALRRIIKLSDTAFRTSYLLGQDAATAFIDLEPGPRFQLISSLIDLEEYERLAKAAGEYARREGTILQDRINKLTGYEDVTSEAVDRLREEAEQARLEEATAAKAAAVARTRAEGAASYSRLRAEIATLEASLSQFDALIGRRPEIEVAAARFQELEARIGVVAGVGKELAEAEQAETALASAESEAQNLQFAELEAAAARAREAAAVSAATAEASESARDEAAAAERTAHEFNLAARAVTEAKDRVSEYAASIERFEAELAQLPALEAETESLEATRKALFPLTAWCSALQEIETLEAQAPSQALQDVTQRREAAESALEAASRAVEAASRQLDTARTEADQAAFELQSLESHLQHRQDSAHEPVCSHCGQLIDPARAQEEIADLSRDIEAARARCEAAAAKRRAAETELGAEQQAVQQLSSELQDLKDDLQAATLAVRQLETSRAGAQEKADAFYGIAPVALAKEVKSTSVTVKLLGAVLDAHSQDSARLEVLGRDLGALRQVQGQLTAVRREKEQATAALTQAEAAIGKRGREVESAADAYEDARQALEECERQLAAARAASQEAVTAANAAEAAHHKAMEQAQQLKVLAEGLRQTAAGHHRTAALLLEGFDAELRLEMLAAPERTLTALQTERDTLTDAPSQLSALQAALQEYGPIQGQRNAKQSECDRLPAEYQVPVVEADADAQACDAAAEAATREARLADSRATLIDERFAQKVQVEEERENAAERQRLFRKLTALLGKTGLQGVLVTGALATITSHANSFLQRLTGGSLQLELAKSDASDELEIKAIDTTSMRDSRNIQALSGSQKFRCAVALAFGIGQYTGAGGMRSMMIDEGFGGLDEAGQQQMVEELKHLATYMDKVIVVSHLEAFRDRDNFPCQIHVTKDGNRSLISNHRY